MSVERALDLVPGVRPWAVYRYLPDGSRALVNRFGARDYARAERLAASLNWGALPRPEGGWKRSKVQFRCVFEVK